MGQWTTNTYRLPDNTEVLSDLQFAISLIIALKDSGWPIWECHEPVYDLNKREVVLHGNESFKADIDWELEIVCKQLGIPMLELLSSKTNDFFELLLNELNKENNNES